ncbi:MAG: adenosylcobalamin-dependent ribonucleoside-diphosphate reductase [Thermoprotei archaeon]
MELPSVVVKRDGGKQAFDELRIRTAISKAFDAVGLRDEKLIDGVYARVLDGLSTRFGKDGKPHVEDIQDLVERTLVEFNLYEVAKAYVVYRKEHEKVREEKKRILGAELDEVDKSLSVNAIHLLASRYLLRDASGKLIEKPRQMFQRVAALVAVIDLVYDPDVYEPAGRPGSMSGVDPGFTDESHVELAFEVGGERYTLGSEHFERLRRLYAEQAGAGRMKLDWNGFLNWADREGMKKYSNRFREYYEIMAKRVFIPNSPTLFNAGTKLGQLSACFVLPVEDSLESIMDAAKKAALVFKSGGGVGINYTPVRPEGDRVSSTGGVASGPVSFMRIIDTLTDVVKQGGKRRGANMGILEVSHPDIEKFVLVKNVPGFLENFNLSVLVTPEFWEHYKAGKPWPLVNPRDGSLWGEVAPAKLFMDIARSAWKSGDPGLVFFDNINRDNPLLESLGPIRSTNPCGEEPLYPYESCNLGSINLYAFVRRDENGPVFDWEEVKRVVSLATRFLDAVIDVNKYPLPEIEEVTKKTRRVGLGIMGLADTLYALGIPYNSEEGFEFMSKVTEYISYYSLIESTNLAKERGCFPLFASSSYARGELPFEGYRHREWWTLDWTKVSELVRLGVRNSHTMSVAPTGSISMIADVSSGLEPQYAIVFEKNATVGKFYYVDPEFDLQVVTRGLNRDKLLEAVAANGGSLQALNGVPDDMKKVFLTAYDVPWWDHVRAQFEVQKWVSAAVSKTINMPAWVEAEDIGSAYLFAHRLGLKGVTVYRDTSKGSQVLATPTRRMGGYPPQPENNTLRMMSELEVSSISGPRPKATPVKRMLELAVTSEERIEYARCPVCGSANLANQEGCVKCLDCGWSNCILA